MDNEVVIGRLKKKIAKLQLQRDYFKAENELKDRMIVLYPYIRTEYRRYNEVKDKDARMRELEKRTREQELLIRHLSNDTIATHEIRQAYNRIIKDEYEKLNTK